MKTIKILLPIAALFISALAFGQRTHAYKHERQNQKSVHSHTDRRERARVNGAINANENASANAQHHANENSVLNGTTTTETKYKIKRKSTDADKRNYGSKKKA